MLKNLIRIVFPLMIAQTLLMGTPTTAPAVYATPAELLAGLTKAVHDGNSPAIADCFDPNGQTMMASSFAAMLVSDGSDSPTTAPADKAPIVLMTKYGLNHLQRRAGETDDQFSDRVALQIKDKRQFLIDFYTSISQPAAKADANDTPIKLEDLEIKPDGTTAVGKLVSHQADGTSMSEDAQFKKIDGSWRFDNALLF